MSIRQELQAVLNRMAAVYQAGDAAGCAALFTDNAEIYSPYAPPTRGRHAIEDLHRQWTAQTLGDKRLDILQAGGDGNTAWCLAEYSEGADAEIGTSLNVFERQADGTWLIRICSLNSANNDPA